MANLKDTVVLGKLNVTDQVIADKIIKLGGTDDDILMGNGSTTSKQELIESLESAMAGNSWRPVKYGSTTLNDTSTTLEFIEGSNIGLTFTSGKLTIANNYSYSLPLATNGTRGGIQIGYTASGANIPLQLSSEQAYIALTKTAIDNVVSEATVSENGFMSADDKKNLTYYVKGTQTASTNAWTGNLTQISALYEGLTIRYWLPYAGTSTGATLNLTLSGGTTTGAKNIYRYSDNYLITTQFAAGSVITMTYNGTNWIVDAFGDSNTVSSAICSTQADFANKIASCTGYVLRGPSLLHIIMTKTNTAASKLTLNVNDQGAKTIYIDGNVSSTSNYNLPAGSYIVSYDGTNYYFRTDNTLTGNITGSASKLNGKSPEITLTPTSDNKIPTSKAVADYIDGLGYITYNNATTTTDGLMSADDKKNLTYYVKGTQTASTGSWTGNLPQVSALYEGLTIRYLLPKAGSGSASLNLTLAGGTTTGAIPIYRYGTTTRITTHFAAGSVITMTYNGTNWIADAYYDSNNYAYVRQYQSGENEEGATNQYPLLARYNLTNKNGTYDTAYSRFHTEAYLDISDGSLTAKGFKYNDATKGTNSYVLLAGGDAKSLNDFSIGIKYQIPQAFNFGNGELYITDSTIQNKITAASILVSRIDDGSNYTFGTFYKTCETESYIYYSDTTNIYWTQNESRAYVKNLKYSRSDNKFTWTPDA